MNSNEEEVVGSQNLVYKLNTFPRRVLNRPSCLRSGYVIKVSSQLYV